MIPYTTGSWIRGRATAGVLRAVDQRRTDVIISGSCITQTEPATQRPTVSGPENSTFSVFDGELAQLSATRLGDPAASSAKVSWSDIDESRKKQQVTQVPK